VQHFTPRPEPTETPLNALFVGEVGTVTQASAGAACFDSKDSLDAAQSAANANDRDGFEQAVNEHALRLAPGDRVRAIGSAGFLGLLVNVRVESGENAGASCWFDDEAVTLKDVRSDSGQ
jgi:hypothetical protein